MNNRMPLIFLMILASTMGFSAEEGETLIRLVSYTNQGHKSSEETVMGGLDFLIVNGEKLNPAQIIAQSRAIKKISQFRPKQVLKTCEAGRFEHILKKGKLIKKEAGCLESERYHELKENFKVLAKDPFIENK